jgi:4'-phosphopantetheinyl transferase
MHFEVVPWLQDKHDSHDKKARNSFSASELPVLGIAVNLRNVSELMEIADAQFEPASGLSLREHEVQLWRVNLEKVAPAESRWRQILSPDELVRADRFHFAQDRRNYMGTRALLRILLGKYVNCTPERIAFVYGEREKPALDSSSSGTHLHFNVSHSGTKALLAFALGREVGVDVEQIRYNFEHEALAKRFFSPAEQQALAALPSSEQCAGFFRCWTRKEAYIKAHGTGLSLPLDGFDVSLVPGEQNALLATRPDAAEANRWSLCEVRGGQGYEAALCVRGQDWRLRC